MGAAGGVIGTIFFLMVSFAAITSSVSVMESIVSCMIDKFHISRKKSTVIVTVYACLVGIIVCLGYNALIFVTEASKWRNGSDPGCHGFHQQ